MVRLAAALNKVHELALHFMYKGKFRSLSRELRLRIFYPYIVNLIFGGYVVLCFSVFIFCVFMVMTLMRILLFNFCSWRERITFKKFSTNLGERKR